MIQPLGPREGELREATAPDTVDSWLRRGLIKAQRMKGICLQFLAFVYREVF